MRILSIISLIFCATFSSNAQQMKTFDELAKKKAATFTNLDTIAWIYDANLSIGINQGLLHNWQAGGELASLNANAVFYGSITRYNKRQLWTNNLDAGYGLFYAYSNNFKPRKTDDRIDFTSKYGYRLSKKSDLYFAALFNAKTQLSKAYDYDKPSWDTFSTSKFFSPFYLTLAPGIEFRKGNQFSLFFSPLASRFTYVDKYYTDKNPEGAYGVPNGKETRLELGAYFTGRYKVEITKSISYTTRLDFYTNYFAKDKKVDGVVVKKDNPGNVDLMWDNFLSFKFYKFFSLNIGVLAIYDNDVPYLSSTTDSNGNKIEKKEPVMGLGWWQIKQFVSFGFNYKIP